MEPNADATAAVTAAAATAAAAVADTAAADQATAAAATAAATAATAAAAATAQTAIADKAVADKVVADKASADKVTADAAAAAAATTVPATYTLTLATDSLLDAGVTDKIAAIARERGLSNVQAQELLNVIDSDAMSDRNARVTAWEATLKADKVLGANLVETQRLAKLAMDKFLPADSDLRTLLAKSGYGSNPGVVRFFHALGKAMAEDKPINAAISDGSAKKSLAERMYPDLK